MDGFKNFLEARLREENIIRFDEFDRQYLNNFPEELWWQAIRYRYSSQVLMQPEPEIRDITIVLSDMRKKVFKNVNTFSKHLRRKLDQMGLDIRVINISRAAAKLAANKERTGQNATLQLAHAIKGGSNKDLDDGLNKFNTAIQADSRTGHENAVREKIAFDEDDLEFLEQIDPKYRVVALQKRYSGSWLKQQTGDVGIMNFAGIEVPVNIKALKLRYMTLKQKGVDFDTNPLPRSSAMRWLARGYYYPGFKNKVRSSQSNLSQAPAEFPMPKRNSPEVRRSQSNLPQAPAELPKQDSPEVRTPKNSPEFPAPRQNYPHVPKPTRVPKQPSLPKMPRPPKPTPPMPERPPPEGFKRVFENGRWTIQRITNPDQGTFF